MDDSPTVTIIDVNGNGKWQAIECSINGVKFKPREDGICYTADSIRIVESIHAEYLMLSKSDILIISAALFLVFVGLAAYWLKYTGRKW